MHTKGLIHIYTGTGKGKTTAAVGLGLRALSHGLDVCYAFFNKKPEKYGNTEINSLEKMGARIEGQDLEHPSFNKSVTLEQMQAETKKNIIRINDLIHTEYFDMLILDEILISVRDGFIDEDFLIRFIQNRPAHMEIVLTGRGASDEMIEIADYVSEIQKIKHPMDEDVPSREGIEF